MKKGWLILLALLFALSLLSGCGSGTDDTGSDPHTEAWSYVPPPDSAETTTAGQVCDHDWVRIENYNESTAVDRCTKCGQTRMYTDPDAMPKGYVFLSPITVSVIDEPDTARDGTDEKILSILKRSHWERGVQALQYAYLIRSGEYEVQYDPDTGTFALFSETRHMTLSEKDRGTVNEWLGTLFPEE